MAKESGKTEEFVLLAETCVHFLHLTCAAVTISAVHRVPSLLSTLWLEPAAPVMPRVFLSALRNSRTCFSWSQQKHRIIPQLVFNLYSDNALMSGMFYLVSPCSFESTTAMTGGGYFELYTEIQTENSIEMEHVCLRRACHFILLRKDC